MITNQKNEQALEIKHTSVFTKNLAAFDHGYRFIVNTGGSRSSKTISILQMLIYISLTKPGIKISIVRQSLPSIRKSVMYDFFKIMEELKIYSPRNHQKTANSYRFPNGSLVEFFGVADSQRIRGSKRDILYCNEANELSQEEFMQLMMRTSITAILDRNPSEFGHWIDELLELEKDKSHNIHSTYKDNSFIPESQLEYIESLINVDPNYYRIYALGLPPTDDIRIYNHFQRYTDISEDVIETIYGLDFGFAHPTAMVKCYKTKLGWFIEEFLYEKGWTLMEIVSYLRSNLKDKSVIYCDSARPDMIEELRRQGFNARSSNKNVKSGIDSVRSIPIYINIDSQHIWNEYRGYYWKTGQNDKPIDEPIKINDDCMDALRYAIHTHKGKEVKEGIETTRFFY